MDSYTDVCRLCSSTHDLLWVFDKKLPGAATISLKDIIFAISGVEIHYKDVISQKICSECYQLAKITYGFREMSIKSNKILKDRYKTLHQTSYITDCTVKEEGVEPKVIEKNVNETILNIHPTIRDVYKTHPNIMLPRISLQFHVNPSVVMEVDSVQNYLKRQEKKPASESLKTIATYEPAKTIELFNSIDTLKTVSSCTAVLNMSNLKSQRVQVQDLDKNIDKPPEKPITNESKPEKTSVKIPKEEVTKPKRILSEDSWSEKVLKKISLAGPTETMSNNSNSSSNDSSMLYVEKSMPLFICEICDSVHNTLGNLRRHMLNHLHCQFCKCRFKSLEMKREHVESSCIKKNSMKSQVSVDMKKIELNMQTRHAYPNAFVDFPSLPSI
ncbi:uncharacterized protein isoform X8 [Leptinotarsa decemlineata]|uniref:uncharacterized protein isoform X8 n=1 Tax=Leptinotarsa decemlineata TaxID=7539 RepID=UPI003D308EBE